MAPLQGDPFFFVQKQLAQAVTEAAARHAGVLSTLEGTEDEINKRWAWSVVKLKNGEYQVAGATPAVLRERLPPAIKLIGGGIGAPPPRSMKVFLAPDRAQSSFSSRSGKF